VIDKLTIPCNFKLHLIKFPPFDKPSKGLKMKCFYLEAAEWGKLLQRQIKFTALLVSCIAVTKQCLNHSFESHAVSCEAAPEYNKADRLSKT